MDFTLTSNCLANIPTQTTGTLDAFGLVPGEVYYLCIDGSAGAICDYAINGSVPTVNGPIDGICVPSSPTAVYTTPTNSTWHITPPSAGNIIGSNVGTSITVQWVEPGPAQVCAQSLQCSGAPDFCLDVTVGEDSHTEEHVDLCQGHTTECAGHTYSQAGSFMVNLPSYLNCDSIINCIVHLIPTVFTTETVHICQGGVATCAGEEFTAPGTYPVKLTAYQGCDSVVNCKVLLVPTYISPYKLVNLCGPASYDVCDNTYTTSGLYTEICKGWLGCDSIVNTNLAILEPHAVIAPPGVIDCGANATITLNGSGSSVNTAVGGSTTYKWNGPGIVGFNNQPTVQVNQAGTYCLIVTHGRGGVFCSDTACVTVTAVNSVPQLPLISGNPIPCGDSTIIYTATASGTPAPTSFVWTIPGNLSYTILSLNTIQITWDTVVAGNLCVTANNSCGPSQPACLPIAVQPPIQQPVMTGPATVCAGGGNYTYTLNIEQIGTTYNWTAPAGAVLTGSGDTVQVNFLAAVSGQVCVTPQNACGTGTAVCTNVQVNPIPTADLSSDAQICAGESVDLHFALTGNGPFDVSWNVGNQNFTLNDIPNGHIETVTPPQTTVYKIVSVSDNSTPACAVAVNDSVTVTVWQHFKANTTAQICEGQSYFVGGAAQTVTGIYTDSLTTIHGCDSVIVTTLTVFDIDTLVISTTTCDPALAGSNTQVFTQTNGCDSVVISTVILLPSDTVLLSDHSCDINNVGVFTQNLLNHYGCDSTVITTVTFALSDTTYLTATTCDPAAVGVFNNLLTSADGCDSLIVTTVTQLPIDTVMLTATSCNPADVGVFSVSLTNQYGCDSTVITTVSLDPLPTTFLTATSCDPAQVGVFTNTLVTAGGCDSIVVTTVTLLPSSTTALTGTSCNPAQVGTFTNVLTNQFGCDSTVTTTITFVPLPTTFLTATTCVPAQAGTFTNTIVTSGGCDSVVVTTVTLLPSSATQLTGSSCNLAEVGTFTQVLPNQFGCDSTITTVISFAPLDTTFLTGTSCDPAQVGVLASTIVTPGGCDSVIVTTVSLLPSNQTPLQTFTCDPALAGVFVYPLVNQYGCDSIVTETRTLLPSSMTTVNLTTCDPAQVGSTTKVLPNQYGCDSTVVTITTLKPADSCSVAATLLGSNIPCVLNTGTLTLTATVGAAPFTYTVLQGATVVTTGTVTALNTPKLITGLPPGNYTVNVNSPNGYSTTTQAVVVQLVPPALTSVANSNFTGFDVSCAGAADGTALATATGGLAPYNYAWSNGGNTAQVTDLMAGTYTVTVTDANTCTNVSTVTLTEPVPLEITFTVNNLDCFGENNGAIQVETSGGAPPYKYSLNNGATQSSNLFGGLPSGAYTLTAADANDCQTTEVIVVNAAVLLDVELGDDINISQGDSTVLQAIVNVPLDSILSVVWTPPFDSSECPGCLQQQVAPFISTVYTIQVQALNGCTDQDKISVIVDRRRQVYVPNIFSPNDDGVNDLLNVFAKPGSVSKINSMQIFDRWGDAIYTLEDFLPNSPTIGWDGTFKGKPLNPGVFVWVLDVEFIDGQRELYKGDVTIVR